MNIIKNYFKTALLLSTLSGLLLFLGYSISGENGLIIALLISTLMTFFSYWFSAKFAILSAGASEMPQSQYPEVYQMTQQLSERMGIPVPKIYISPSGQPNAFATGRNPRNGVICLTAGLLKSMSKDQVEGVIAHELAHIKHRDIFISSVAAMIATAISYLSNIFMFASSSDREDRNPFAAIMLLFLSPIIAAIIQFAISRSREYSADELAVRTTKNPEGLASALRRIEELVMYNPMSVSEGYQSLYIQNPVSSKSLMKIFSTHPPTEERVRAIYSIEL